MTARLVILNGGSSSGKSTIVRCLQAVLPEAWLAFGVDDFVDALPAAMQASDAGIDFGADGEVIIGPVFRRLQAAWTDGIVAMCRSGAGVIIDDVFLGGAASQQGWADALGDLDVLWVGVHCDPAVAERREVARGDRPIGMAASQATIVHEGVKYDVEVDTTDTEPRTCAESIARHLT